MPKESKHEILIVDDDHGVRHSLELLLQTAGYDVSLAVNGFDALLQLKHKVPSILLSDLNMPEMSGFELLSVVRRRFPQIPVIAMSAANQTGDAESGGVIADAFFAKGESGLLQTIAALLDTVVQVANNHRETAPVCIPRYSTGSTGVPYLVLTCTDCLRSFPLSVTGDDPRKLQETSCLFCRNIVRYVIDFSSSVASHADSRLAASSGENSSSDAVRFSAARNASAWDCRRD